MENIETFEASFIKTPEEIDASINVLQAQLESLEKDPHFTADAGELKKIIANLELRKQAIQN